MKLPSEYKPKEEIKEPQIKVPEYYGGGSSN
jgi:hypothetical protein